MRADGAIRPKQRFDVIERRLLIVEMLCGEDGLCHALNLAIVGRFVKYHIVGAGLLALVAGSALATTADARPFYAKVSVGETTNTEVSGFSLSDGDAYGVAIGSTLGPLRVEAGVDRLEASVNLGPTITANALDYHATGYFDLPVGDKASVFAGAGHSRTPSARVSTAGSGTSS